MKMHSGGDASDFMSLGWEANAPRQSRRVAPATACEKTPQPAENAAQCDARCARVCGLPPSQLPTTHHSVAGDDRSQQSAIENSARAQKIEREKQQGILPVLRLREEHQKF